MHKMLLVLIDGLPFWKVGTGLTPCLSALRCGPLEPGLGFSINIYPELFAGLQPDDLGFFNKWGIKSEDEFVVPGKLALLGTRLLDSTRVFQPLSRAVHKVWQAAGGCGNLANVPFSYLPYYTKNPDEGVFASTSFPTIFGQLPGWRFSLSCDFAPPGEQDAKALAMAASHIEEWDGHIFVLLGDLDGTAHRYGLGRKFDNHLRWVDERCRDLSRQFLSRHGGDGIVVIVSDHGMSETDPAGRVSLNLESRFGPVGYSSYIYFLDALMLRVWVFEPSLLGEIDDFLDGLRSGRTLTPDDRAYFGATNSQFGSLIHVLEEGRAFYPSFFGALYPKAMHGYDPRLDSQKAIVVCSVDGIKLPTRAREVYDFLISLGTG